MSLADRMRQGPRAQLEKMAAAGPNTGIAERLRIEMARRQMTQQWLAERLGYTQTAVSYWTTGKRQPSLIDLCRLADEFGVSTDYLLGRSEGGYQAAACTGCGRLWGICGGRCGGRS